MAYEFGSTTVVLEGNLSVEDIEGFKEAFEAWCDKAKTPKVDLQKCLHIHSAGVQFLMKTKCEIVEWPPSSEWTMWLKAGLS